jgi:hypothetical protein
MSMKGMPALSWEQGHPDRSSWSDQLIAEIGKAIAILTTATDITFFCPQYQSLRDNLKIAIWAELLVQVAFFESAWKPCCRYREDSMGIDPITKEQVYSEGLLQLSYQDLQVLPSLPFDWAEDQKLSRNDCAKTILDPLKNLTGGVNILTHQISRHRAIILSTGVYWSTLKDAKSGRHSKVLEIKNRMETWATTALAGK